MSDPFAEIENEVSLDRIKKFLKKYKFLILGAIVVVVLIPTAIGYNNYYNEKKNKRISGYFIEIISLLNQDEDKALRELKKLSKLDHDGFIYLSELIQAKLNLKNNNFNEAKTILDKIDLNLGNKNNQILKKIIIFYNAQASLELNDKKSLDENIGKLLAFGDNWALLAHEIRGHYYFKNEDYINAEKDFNKILNEQISSRDIRARALEMMQNIKMYNDINN